MYICICCGSFFEEDEVVFEERFGYEGGAWGGLWHPEGGLMVASPCCLCPCETVSGEPVILEEEHGTADVF